jgi:hypothetical protein
MQRHLAQETMSMHQGPILQMTNGEPEISASVATYTDLVHQWGLPATHTQLLQELQAWIETTAALRRHPVEAMQRVLDIEGSILMDASVAGVAAEHIPFLYTVLGEVFESLGPRFRRELNREAALAERVYEDAIRAQMGDTGEDRLEAIYHMENVALQRLQERQERVTLLIEGLTEEDSTALSQ